MPPKSSSRRDTATPELASRTQTPGRSGLRSQTPIVQGSGDQSAQRELPHLQSRTSNAYGGPSRTDIARQSRVATGAAEVATVFGAALNNAIERTEDLTADTPSATRRQTRSQSRAGSEDSDAGSAPAAPVRRKAKTAQSAPAMPSIPESRNSPAQSAASNNISHDTTALDNSAAGGFITPSSPGSIIDGLGTNQPTPSYMTSHFAPSSQSNTAYNQFTDQTGHAAPPSNRNAGFSLAADFWQLIPRNNLLRLLTFFSVVCLSFLLASPKIFSHVPILRNVATFVEAGETSVASMLPTFRNSSTGGYPWTLHYRIKALEDSVASLEKSLYYHDSQLEGLMQFLPERIIMRRDEKTGQYRITEDFWKAIRAEVEGKGDGSWDDFIESNNKKLDEYIDAKIQSHKDQNFQAWHSESGEVSKEEFMDILKANFASLQGEIQRNSLAYETRLRAMEVEHEAKMGSLDKDIPIAVDKSLSQALQGLPKYQMGNIATVNLVNNAEMHLKKVNYFSPSLGAVVDPFASSPTANSRTPNQPHWGYFKAFKGVRPNPHIMALEPWSEPRDCWCAAPPANPRDDILTRDPETSQIMRGAAGALTPRLQLGVILPQPVYPKEVTIEHFPMRGHIDSSAMPKDMELWASVPDAAAREVLTEDSDVFYREDTAARRAQMRGRDHALPETYVKIGVFQYDGWGPNHVQTFRLDVSALKRGIGVRRFILRATSSYGGDATCLYRVRLHGEGAPAEGFAPPQKKD